MKIYAISDLHLSFQTDKPMDLFGGNWTGYEKKIKADWNSKVGPGDIGVIAGDLSWGMNFKDSVDDLKYISDLSGTKIVIRGNHDYWWSSITRVREALGPTVYALQNDAVRLERDGKGIVFCGTRGWRVPERRWTQKPDDKKIFDREVIRLELALQDANKKKQEGDKVVCVIHYPPFNAMRDDSAFTQLMEKYGVNICVYGHLHGSGGRHELLVNKGGIRYYLTSCDLLDHKVAEISVD
ncbi:MAG: metallophosphoesterase [Firmicutes bacterium]|nr:metallophosphoesterase [Bacillota bacterium]